MFLKKFTEKWFKELQKNFENHPLYDKEFKALILPKECVGVKENGVPIYEEKLYFIEAFSWDNYIDVDGMPLTKALFGKQIFTEIIKHIEKGIQQYTYINDKIDGCGFNCMMGIFWIG